MVWLGSAQNPPMNLPIEAVIPVLIFENHADFSTWTSYPKGSDVMVAAIGEVRLEVEPEAPYYRGPRGDRASRAGTFTRPTRDTKLPEQVSGNIRELQAPDERVVVILIVVEDSGLAVVFEDTYLVDVVIVPAEGQLEANQDEHEVTRGFVQLCGTPTPAADI